jgi:uncharacterized membrane protein YcfT
MCVLLVVFHHVARQFSDVAPEQWLAANFWLEFDAFLTPIRIPLFFAISGMLASSALTRNLDSTRSRTIGPAYLYVVWTFLLSLRLLVPGQSGQDHSYISNLVAGVFLAGGGYWYLYALPVYFLVCVLFRKLPLWPLLTMAVILNLLREPLTAIFKDIGFQVMDEQSLIGSILANLLFFVIGARCRDLVLRHTLPTTALRIILTFIFYAGLVLAQLYWLQNPILELLTSLLGIAFGIFVSRRLERSSVIRKPLEYIGARTLPVYVSQFFFISILSFAWNRVAISTSAATSTQWLAWIYPLAAVAVVAVVSLAFYRTAMSNRVLRNLFQPPSWLTASRNDRPIDDNDRK